MIITRNDSNQDLVLLLKISHILNLSKKRFVKFITFNVISFTGYGHSTPKTVGGKLFCIFYALAGIPLGLIMFQSIGERLNTFTSFIIKHIKKCLKLKSTEVGTMLVFNTKSFPFLLIHLGYGLSTPKTTGGKVFTMFYALVGIPLNLVMYQSVGERLNTLSSCSIKTVKRFLQMKDMEEVFESVLPAAYLPELI